MRGEFLVGLSRATREAASVQIGDTVTFTLELDRAPREVELPPALAAALDSDPEARRSFDGLAYTHRREFARWVAEAKRDETRERRVAQAVEMIRAGRPGPDPHLDPGNPAPKAPGRAVRSGRAPTRTHVGNPAAGLNPRRDEPTTDS